MSEEGWTTVTLGDIAENISVRVDDPSKSGLDRFVGLQHLDSGSVTVSKWDSTESVTSSMKQFQAGDVLLARRNAHLRRASAVDFEGVCSGDAYVLREKPKTIVPGLLKYILNTNRFWEYAIANADGSMSSRAKWKHLENYELKISDKTKQVDALRILDQIVLHETLLSSSLLNSAKIELNYYSNKFSKLAKNFPTIRLSECISEKITTGHSPAATKEKTGHSLLTLAALSKHGYVDGCEKPTQPIPKVKVNSVRKGDVLISRSNTRDLVGLAGVVEETRDDLSFPDLMFRVRVDTSKILPHYLEAFLLSKFGRFYMMSNAQGTSGSMKKINTKMLRDLPVPMPPIEEQSKIVQVRNQLKNCVRLGITQKNRTRILLRHVQTNLKVFQ
jgi:type I restriction enzyme S subunit